MGLFERAAHLAGGFTRKLEQYDAGPVEAVRYIKENIAKRSPHLVLPDEYHAEANTADFSGKIQYGGHVLVYSQGKLVEIDPEEQSATARFGGAGGGRGG